MDKVFSVQIAISFLLWIGAGIAMMRAAPKLRAHAFSVSRNARGIRSAALFLASPVCIFAPLWILSTTGAGRPDRLLPAAWLLVTLGGFGCVVCATVGLAYAVSIAMEAARDSRVTTGDTAASNTQESSDR